MEILYSDDRVAVCLKPPGILSTDEPGGMPELIRRALGDENAAVRSVHRLDRAVGGVMVYARTRRAAADLSRQIEDGRFEKTYMAVVQGIPSAQSGVMEDYLLRDRAARKTFAADAESPGAQRAVLSYECLAAAEGFCLLQIRLHTGRTHQIRCQLSARSLPIAGDKKYGGSGEHPVALWSCALRFFHPRTGEEMRFSQRPPDSFPWNLFSIGE